MSSPSELVFTLNSTSPMITYAPTINISIHDSLPKSGWQVSHSGDDVSYFASSPGASFELQFYGMGLELWGSAGCPYNVTIDSSASLSFPAMSGAVSFFQGWWGLQTTHTWTLTVACTDGSEGAIAFSSASIIMEIPQGETPSEIFYGVNDSLLEYNGSWSISPETTLTSSLAETSNFGDFVSLSFYGIAVAVNGPTANVSSNSSYGVSLDDTPGQAFRTNPMSNSQLFYQGGLDPTHEHSIVLVNTGLSSFAFSSIVVWTTSTTTSTTASSSSIEPSTSAPSAHAGIGKHSNVAKIVAPIIAVIAVVTLCIAFCGWKWRRKHRSTATLSGPFGLRFSRAFKSSSASAMALNDIKPRAGHGY
ncbi:hypothetical protein OBBRIDRAFT_829281 [Obba rivulosa]|uniref:Uncharacterized protein n=1 Tax=Obba rivulosa TaxID=1052685 RepID=A0A8E2AM63_9APHY|nr:hypothetical protein OBBRIDRAFT_829281 [Obba rivulosa]